MLRMQHIWAVILLAALGTTAQAQESFDDLFEDSAPSEEELGTKSDADEDDAAADVGSFDDLFVETPAAAAAAAASSSGVRFTGFVQNELAYGYTGPDPHFQHFLTRAKLYLKGSFNPRVSWQVGGHIQYNPVFDFETFYPDRVDRDQKLDGWVDETFLDISAGKWEFRLGRQHIIWGEMVGLFFADVISALDLRQFLGRVAGTVHDHMRNHAQIEFALLLQAMQHCQFGFLHRHIDDAGDTGPAKRVHRGSNALLGH